MECQPPQDLSPWFPLGLGVLEIVQAHLLWLEFFFIAATKREGAK
jgi:hypothetical protein